ncbi:unnamed protein product, partial [Arabidopsis halleri]
MNTSVPEKSTEPDEGVDVNNLTCDEGKEGAAAEEEEEAVDKTDPEKSIETGEVHRANIHGVKTSLPYATK